ncbi:glutamine synthetase family protein [Pseudooceanicola aestuarii]|uniref:glutamine synthetase family protein n=1 Tax=Pseudooceanicola aestuarii TaxID=2697319 RepID=UPI0013D1F073|nr:glutamine synthetase family protein [Pseudooceanicola aestuarii]
MSDPLVFAATCDIAGKVRGKGFPLSALDKRLEKGVGWTPTNVMISCFDGIAEGPFGSLGDLLLMPDAATQLELPLSDRVERVMLGDITTLDGTPWACCTRSLLKGAIARLERVAGVRAIATFEHEFQLLDHDATPGDAFSLAGFSVGRRLGERVMAALRAAGMQPDTFLREFGAGQYELTIDPTDALTAADQATMLREIVKLIAADEGERATFTPIRDAAGVGNGVHVHFSFVDAQGQPCTWDAAGQDGLAPVTSAFAAGILKYMPAILAFTAPSRVSYLRLTPHRWSAAYNNLGDRDRESSLRICPVAATDPDRIARQFNLEYRAADAAAAPHLVLAMLLHAGCQGIDEGLTAPPATQEDLSLLSPEALADRGIERLPQSLEAALDRLAAEEVVQGWLPEGFREVYIAHKRGELDELSSRSMDEACAAYAAVY